MKNLDNILNKIVYLKSHAINMMFKDAIILKKEKLNEETIKKGSLTLEKIMKKAMESHINTALRSFFTKHSSQLEL